MASLSIEDLAVFPVVQASCSLPDYWGDPVRTPGGAAISAGPRADTFQEVLALIGAGRGVFPVGAHVATYYPRPGVTYVPFRDTPPLEWVAIWRRGEDSARVDAFNRAALDAAWSPGRGRAGSRRW